MNWSSDWSEKKLKNYKASDSVVDTPVAVKKGDDWPNLAKPLIDIIPDYYNYSHANDGTVKFIHEDIEYEGTLVGDLVVYSDWGWKVIHYPTLAKFDDPVKGALPAGNYSKETLLRWCDTVQTKHGQLWAILRELTPDTYNDKSDRVMKAKDQIRNWCLSVEVK